MFFGTETIAVRRPGGTDPDGSPLDYTTPVGPVEGCDIEPLSGTELLEVARTGDTGAVRVLLPITEGLDGECELQIRGDWYRIVGGAEAFTNDDPELAGYDLTCTRGGGV